MIKFTIKHTKKLRDPDLVSCPCPAQDYFPFLETSLSVSAGKINSDLYRKKTDRCQYLLPSSCHPPHCTDNIPYSLALRIQRICTDAGERDQNVRCPECPSECLRMANVRCPDVQNVHLSV